MMSAVYIGIEVPRTPQVLPDGTVLSNGEWRAGKHNLLRRWMQLANQVTGLRNIRLLTGAPDQAVYDLMDEFSGVMEMGLTDWMHWLSNLDDPDGTNPAVIHIRGEGVARDHSPILRAYRTLKLSTGPAQCEVAVVPQSFPLADMITFHSGRAVPFHEVAGISPEEFSGYVLPCPLISSATLASYRKGAAFMGLRSATKVLVLDEEDLVLIEGPLDLIRAEKLCDRYPVNPNASSYGS